MNDLSGRVALVTGGSRGMGAATALALAERGADVAVTYLNSAQKAEAVIAQIEALGRRGRAIRADSADPDQIVDAVNATADAFGRLDILVNNAGIFKLAPVEEFTREDVERMLGTHVNGVFLASQAAARRMADGGRIISIGSSLARHAPGPGFSLYSMSKSALIGFTKGLARDLGPRGITVNTIDPGSTDTDMNPADGPFADEGRSIIPLGRYCAPGDIAAMVVHLAGKGGANITGASIAIDAGVNA
ncbi:3-oxoacyl-ACP reductase FabG [Pelagibacterium sp. HS1C4-1]|nr:3-oxoacyl-ACP reductase family protein [Pelagibacterium xiamenense]MCD7059539.1 3-oxoacyl-ACP reductase FabG [Pelagibacterium xiamenense]